MIDIEKVLSTPNDKFRKTFNKKHGYLFDSQINTAKNVVAATFLSFQTWGIVAVMYLIVILLLQWAAKVLERRLKYESR
jgi:hypothetical protein